jgi:hypothetical protein
LKPPHLKDSAPHLSTIFINIGLKQDENRITLSGLAPLSVELAFSLRQQGTFNRYRSYAVAAIERFSACGSMVLAFLCFIFSLYERKNEAPKK